MAFARRELMAAAAGAAIGREWIGFGQAAKPVRVAFLTDFHIQPEQRAGEGSAAAIRHAMALKPAPDVIIGGGDLIMDGFAAEEARTKVQFDLLRRTLAENTDRPFYPVLGNHDVWGWDEKASKTTGKEPKWGKRWFLDEFQRDRSYYAVEHGGWRLVVLDTVFRTPDGYNGRIEDEQFEWLRGQLQTEKPVLIASHIPLFAPCTMMYGYNPQTGWWNVGGNLMTKNFNDVKKLFDERPNVKVCLSGHIHLQDRYDYNGVGYLCGGAVSGAWWGGRFHDFDPAYLVLDLWPDGRWEHRFVSWGWRAA